MDNKDIPAQQDNVPAALLDAKPVPQLPHAKVALVDTSSSTLSAQPYHNFVSVLILQVSAINALVDMLYQEMLATLILHVTLTLPVQFVLKVILSQLVNVQLVLSHLTV